MLLAQVFKTWEGATKRARFENAHCGGRYWYSTVRMLDGVVDTAFPVAGKKYEYRIRRQTHEQRKEQGYVR